VVSPRGERPGLCPRRTAGAGTKGHGYPVALSEAHEQAVVEDTLATERLPVVTSEKARTKRTRYV